MISAEELERIYDFLEPRQDDNIMVSSEDAMLVGAYIAGRARSERLNVTVRCLVTPGAELDSEAKITEVTRRSFADKLGMIQSGFSRISFRICDFLKENVAPDFNKFFYAGELGIDHIRQMNTHAPTKLVLLQLPFAYAGLIETGEGGFMRKKMLRLSLRQLLRRIGMSVKYYDVHGKSLWAAASWLELDKRLRPFRRVKTEDFAALVRKEIFETIRPSRPGSQFALRSGEGEYLYIIEALPSGKSMLLKFVFLDDTHAHEGKGVKQFSILIVPDTPTFRAELDSKDILVVPASRVFEMFGERVEF
jgi:hypothetical protein